MLRTQLYAYELKTMFASSIREVYVVNIARVSRLLVCWLELELTLIQTKAHRKELTESALGSAGAWTCTHLQCRRAGDV